jgi:hypothetical protein
MPRSIIGESFKPYVSDQINTRQSKLSLSPLRDPDLLKYMSNKTSWVRLSSGVNLSPERARQLGVGDFNGNLLAKKSVLFSARKYENYSLSQGNVANSKNDWSGDFTKGLWYDNSNPSYGYTPAIGIGGQDLSKANPQDLYNYGLTPPPGIKSVDIKSLNRGSLREATVEIECHNLAQFRIIEALYLRLKFSVFLEWGHTFWYDNEGNLRSDMPDDVHQGFLNGNYDQDSLLEDLENRRKAYCGNYDGYLGYVRNFSWSIRKDGGYDITLNLISIGDVIESLKLNTNYPGLISGSSGQNQNNQPLTVANKNKSTLNQILFAIQNEVYNQGYLDGFNSGNRSALFAEDIIRLTKDISKYDLQGFNYKSPEEIWNRVNNILTYQEGVKAFFSSISMDEESSTGGIFYYIKLGTLLRLIESFLLKYDTSKQDKNGSYKPLFYIDHDFDTNICLTLPRQISTDPRICLLKPGDTNQFPGGNASATTQYIKYTYTVVEEEVSGINNFYWDKKTETVTSDDPDFNSNNILKREPTELKEPQEKEDDTEEERIYYVEGKRANDNTPGIKVIFFQSIDEYNDRSRVITTNSEGDRITTDNQKIFSKTLADYYRVDNYPFIGKFMHIHVNLDFISKTLNNNIDEDGKMSLYEFLTQIIKGIQEATGQINDFEVVYNDATNTFSIIDNSIIPDGHKYLKSIIPDLNIDIIPTPFNINLLKENEGSFVTDMSIKSELTNAFATQISIGAQSNGNKVGENATAISKLSDGYIDRIITNKSSIIDRNNSEGETDTEKSKSPTEVYTENLIAYSNIKNKINEGTITFDDISNNTQGVVDLLKYELGYYTQQGNIAGVGFIPINLSLTCDGLSGPRIYESYTINETLLPENYYNNIKFITRGVSHKIDESGWSTTLESLSAPRLDELKQVLLPKDPVQTSSGNASIIKSYTDNSNVPTPKGSGLCKSISSIPDVNYIRNNKIGGTLSSNPEIKIRKSQGIGNGDTRGLVRIAATGNNVLAIGGESALLTPKAKAALEAWMNDITNQGGCMTISSVFRTFSQQYAVKQQKIKEGRGKSAAEPGSSPHGWGIAIDIRELYRLTNGNSSPSANAKARESKIYKFLASTGEKYGWYNPWRLADGSGTDECWHFEYWG